MKRTFLFSALLLFCVQIGYGKKFESLAMTPPMGWNSWNTFEVNINEKLIMETADLLVSNGMKDAGYIYVVIDDGWEAKQRDADGNLIPDPVRFPSGMKALGDYLHARGFKFGIHNCAGFKTCSGYPGTRGHEFQDARTYASWGVDYLKYDWCDTTNINAKEAYSTMSKALRAAGRPVVFSLCEWGTDKPWEWAADIGHLWRTTGDITDCYDCQEVYSLGFLQILEMQEGLEKYAGPGHWNDPDMLEVGNPGLTLTESRTHFSLWCMLAAPLMAGNDLRIMSDEILDILTNLEMIAIDQDPLGKQGYLMMDHPGKQIWVKELSGGDWAICLFNPTDEPTDMRVKWKQFVVLDADTEYSARDIWVKKDLGTTRTKTNFNITILPHDVIIYRLTKLKTIKPDEKKNKAS